MNAIISDRHGMTLLEIIIAIAILGIIAISVLTMFTSGFSTIFAMGRKTQAMNNQAQLYMDQIYNSTSKSSTIAAIDSLTGVAVSNGSGPISGLNLITITVDYPPNRSIKLSGLVPIP